MIWCSAKQSKYFQRCNVRNDGDCKNFDNFIAWIEITMNFERPEVLQTHSQSLKSSNFNHSRTTFILTISYFLAHYFGTCIMNLLVSILKKRKKNIPTLVGNKSVYILAMGRWLGMGSPTLVLTSKRTKKTYSKLWLEICSSLD